MTQLHVVVLILINEQNQVLVSKRQKHQSFAEYWEFPGGKVEVNESPFEALQREVQEELGFSLEQAKPLINVNHDYDKFSVLLEAWVSQSKKPLVHSNEGQKIQWASLEVLEGLKFPEANTQILKEIKAWINSNPFNLSK